MRCDKCGHTVSMHSEGWASCTVPECLCQVYRYDQFEEDDS